MFRCFFSLFFSLLRKIKRKKKSTPPKIYFRSKKDEAFEKRGEAYKRAVFSSSMLPKVESRDRFFTLVPGILFENMKDMSPIIREKSCHELFFKEFEKLLFLRFPVASLTKPPKRREEAKIFTLSLFQKNSVHAFCSTNFCEMLVWSFPQWQATFQ